MNVRRTEIYEEYATNDPQCDPIVDDPLGDGRQRDGAGQGVQRIGGGGAQAADESQARTFSHACG